MVNLNICGREEIPNFDGKSITHLVSFRDPEERPNIRPNWPTLIDHTEFVFDDLESLQDGAPMRDDIDRLINHLHKIVIHSNTNDVNLLCQCFAGIGRSPSAAFMFICMLHDWPEEKSWEFITKIRPCAWGNRRMVQFADNILAKGGTMIGALKKFQLENSNAEGGLWLPSPIGYQRKF